MATAKQQHKEGESGFNTPLVVLGAVAVVFFVYAFALFMQGGFLTVRELEKTAKIAEAPADEGTESILAEQRSLLNQGYHWVDQEQGVVGMSIDDAKVRLVENLKAQQGPGETAEHEGTQ